MGSVLAALFAGALVAVLVLQPWTGPDHPRFPRATVAANGHECASVGRYVTAVIISILSSFLIPDDDVDAVYVFVSGIVALKRMNRFRF